MVDGPKHRVIVFDNRTRRSYGSRLGPPGNVSVDAMLDQLPLPPLPAGREILIVVAPLQVIGPPVLDDIVAPGSYRAFDLGGISKTSDLSPSSTTGLRQMTGTNPDAVEAWAFDASTFEHLLERLEPYGRVVLLSGDVHYSSGTLMSYWRGNAPRPARFAQFTSSGFKNVMPSRVTFVDRSIGFAQQMVRANLGAERIAWDQPLEDLVLLPEGTSQIDLVPVMRARLQSVPVHGPDLGLARPQRPRAALRPEARQPAQPRRPARLALAGEAAPRPPPGERPGRRRSGSSSSTTPRRSSATSSIRSGARGLPGGRRAAPARADAGCATPGRSCSAPTSGG